MKWLHRFLVPSEQNGFKPNSLEQTAAAIMLLLVVLTFAVANVQSLALISSDWFISSILPGTLIELTNENRGDNALSVLTENSALDDAAQLKADDMAKGSYFAHTSPDGVTPWHWFEDAGYTYAYAGENLAVHFTDSDDVVKAWMNSPGHRANILGSHYTQIGIGSARGVYKGTPTVFVVQLFGTPLGDVKNTAPAAVAKAIPKKATTTLAAAQVLGVQDEEVRQPAKVTATHITQRAVNTLPPLSDAEHPLPQNNVSQVATTSGLEQIPATTTADVAFGSTNADNTVTDVRSTPDTVLYSDLATSVATLPATIQSGTSYPLSFYDRLLNLLSRMATSPHTFISLIYLMLTFVVAALLGISVTLEWRHQHPIQVAYGVGLIAAMFLLFTVHLSLTSGVLIT